MAAVMGKGFGICVLFLVRAATFRCWWGGRCERRDRRDRGFAHWYRHTGTASGWLDLGVRRDSTLLEWVLGMSLQREVEFLIAAPGIWSK